MCFWCLEGGGERAHLSLRPLRLGKVRGRQEGSLLKMAYQALGDGGGEGFAITGCCKTGFFLRVGDKPRFDQYCRTGGLTQHCEPGVSDSAIGCGCSVKGCGMHRIGQEEAGGIELVSCAAFSRAAALRC